MRQRFESFDDYWGWIVDQPDDDFPICSLARQIETSIQERTKGEDKKNVETAIRRAARELVFLFDLCLHLDEDFGSHSQAIGLLAILALEGIRSAIETRDLSDFARWGAYQCYVEMHALEVFKLKAAIEHVEKKYFDGHSLLLKSRVEELDRHVATVDQVAADWNQLLLLFRLNPEESRRKTKAGRKSLGPLDLDLDLEALKKSVDSNGWTKNLIDCAKAEALEMTGERDAAISILKRVIGGR